MIEKRYLTWKEYLTKRFGKKVHKITLDIGASCPHRDPNDITKGGCIYCDWRGSGSGAFLNKIPLEQQIQDGINALSKRYKAKAFFLYFQSYTTPLIGTEKLKETIDKALSHATKLTDIVGISIGTRPDTIPDDMIEILQEYTQRLEVWIEIGVQTMSPQSLRWLNRKHKVADTINAFKKLSNTDIKICSHLILGIPGETIDDMIDSTLSVCLLGTHSIKFHPLHVLKDTPLHYLYENGKYTPLTLDEYIKIITDCIKATAPNIIIQRITAEAPRKYLIAPLWCLQKQKVIQKIDEELQKQNAKQGDSYLFK